MSMLNQAGGTVIVPPSDTSHFLTREEQVHFTDYEKSERRKELARKRAKAAAK